MKTTFISYEKMSKKQQREFNARQRASWGNANPIARTFPDKKKFNKADRNKQRVAMFD